MAIQTLHIRDFRNIAAQDWRLQPGLNVLEGENAQGKTNFLEALYVLANGKSFRAAESENLIRFGQAAAELEARWEHEGLGHHLVMRLLPEGRETRFQGKEIVRLAPVQATLRVLVFTPDSSTLFRSSPGARRRYFDHAVALQRPAYAGMLSRYQRILRQRNQLLEQGGGPRELQESFDQAWAEAAFGLMREREAYLRDLEIPWRRRFRELLGSETELSLAWEGELLRDGIPEPADLMRALEGVREAERRYGRSLLGPQRDDLAARLAGHAVKEVASQGQQRMLVIALKLAEADLFQERSGKAPVFLLDDLGSELDAGHQKLLLDSLAELRAQTVLTTAQSGVYAALRAKTYRVQGGVLTG